MRKKVAFFETVKVWKSTDLGWRWFSRGLHEAAKGITFLSSLYFFSLIINDGCFKLRNSAGEIQFSPGSFTPGKKEVSKPPCFAVYICRSAPTEWCYVQFDNGSYMLLTNHSFCECVLQLVGGLSLPDWFNLFEHSRPPLGPYYYFNLCFSI